VGYEVVGFAKLIARWRYRTSCWTGLATYNWVHLEAGVDTVGKEG